MKQIILTLLVGIGMFIGGCGESKQGITGAAPKAAAEEIYLDICSLTKNEFQMNYYPNDDSLQTGWKYAFDSNDFRKGNDGLKVNFKLMNSEDSIKVIPEYLSLESINNLCAQIIASKDYNKTPGQKNTFASLKMTYGFDDVANKFIIIYEPIILKKRNSAKNKYIIYDYVSTSKNNYLSDGRNGLKLIADTNELNRLKFNYAGINYTGNEGKVFIKHASLVGNDNGKFINSPDLIKGDIKFCVMPLQQIYRMYKKSKAIDDCTKLDISDLLSFNFVANDYFKTEKESTKNHKLHIVVYSTSNNKAKNTINNEGEGADFGQLSPPNDSYVKFEDALFNP